ncbi:hypothetical protein [Aeromonas caviae]|uniref:hypothetical protein n=1 Tax=Aeromonas caviae TaxID=648 RepID=UPI0025B6FD85|nr:hypothetical protein [Aeromonas caviae]
MAAFELRAQVSSCKAWRGKSAEQIDEDFMMTVVILLVLDNPLIAPDGTLLSWHYEYKDRRGPKPLSPKEEGEVALSYLQKRVSELSYQIEKFGTPEMIDAGAYGLVSELKDMRGKYKSILLDVSRQLDFNRADASVFIL